MGTTPKNLIPSAQLTASAATIYTATNVKTRIDKFTCTNNDTVARTITIHLINSGGTAGDDNKIINAKSLAAGECYTCPEIVGHWLNASQFIQGLADVAAKVTVRASGIEST